MVSVIKSKSPPLPGAEPAWDIARLFPFQGDWEDDQYLSLDTNHLIELTDGYIRVLPMPTPSHQRIVRDLVRGLEDFSTPRNLGEVLFAPLPVRLRKRQYREPDVIFILAEHSKRVGEKYCQGADLIMEVVSKDGESYERDWVEKRREYAAARIREYWIVDPQVKKIVVLRLRGKSYIVYGEFGPGQRALSVLLPGFAVDVDSLFAASKVA